MRKLFGTDGIRGEANTHPMTTDIAMQVGRAIAFIVRDRSHGRGIVIGKEIFGGTGRNFLNPALTGRAFLYFAYPAQNSGDAIWTVLSGGKTVPVDAFTGATPLSIAAVTGPSGNLQTTFADAGYSTAKLFFGLYPGSIGGTSAFLAVVGAAFVIELDFLNGREALAPHEVFSLVQYGDDE